MPKITAISTMGINTGEDLEPSLKLVYAVGNLSRWFGEGFDRIRCLKQESIPT